MITGSDSSTADPKTHPRSDLILMNLVLKENTMKRSNLVKMLVLLLVCVFFVGTLANCASGPSEPQSTESSNSETEVVKENNTVEEPEGQVRDSLIIAIPSEPPSLSPVDNDTLSAIYMNLLTNNLLFRANPVTLDVEPDLVESYEQTSDTVWVFKLHEGVLFHHGKELVAEDVVASIENAKTYSASKNYTEQIATVEATGKYEVTLTTGAPYANLLYDLAYHFNYILPKDLIESGHDFSTQIVGTGPYKFVEWKKGDYISFERNDNYWNKEEMPTIKTIIWRIIPEGTTRTLALETGEIDVNYTVETADIQRLKDNPDIHVEQLMSVENMYLVLNNQLPPFDDMNLRNAIHCAIDREAIIEGALNGYGVPSYSSIPMGYWGSHHGNANTYDLEKAREYLAAWGGDPSTVELTIMANSDDKARIATVIQANLAEIGINVVVEPIEAATWHSRRSAGDYVSGITSWSPSNAFTYLMRYNSDKNLAIPGSCNDAEVDALIAEMKQTMDSDKRLEVMHKLVERVNVVNPQPSLYQVEYFRAWNANLEGIVCTPTGYMKLHTAKWVNN